MRWDSYLKTMEQPKRVLVFIISIFLIGWLLYTSISNSNTSKAFNVEPHIQHVKMRLNATKQNTKLKNFETKHNATQQIYEHMDTIYFDFSKDVLVDLHIQKTGGSTFNRHLVSDLNVGQNRCKCRQIAANKCSCRTREGNIWLFR